jgi:hypothetical protein
MYVYCLRKILGDKYIRDIKTAQFNKTFLGLQGQR